MANALLTFFEDPKQLELVNTVIQKTQQGRLRWNKSATRYEAHLPTGVQLMFVLSPLSPPALFFLKGKTWAQFIVRQRDGSETANVQQSFSLPGGGKSSLETAVDRLFQMVSESEDNEVDSVIDQLKKL